MFPSRHLCRTFSWYLLQQPGLGSTEVFKLVKYWVGVKGSVSTCSILHLRLGEPSGFRVGPGRVPHFQSSSQRGCSHKVGQQAPCDKVLSQTLSSDPSKPPGHLAGTTINRFPTECRGCDLEVGLGWPRDTLPALHPDCRAG